MAQYVNKKNKANKLLRQSVIKKRMDGWLTQEIADDVGISRGAVSRILNSEEVKKLISSIDLKLANGIEDAIRTVVEAASNDATVAMKLLQNFGSMIPKVKVEHDTDASMTIIQPDGTRVEFNKKKIEQD